MNYDLDSVPSETEEAAEVSEESAEEEELSEEEEQKLEEERAREEERERVRRKLKLITPMVMLTAGAVMSIYLFLKDTLLGDYLVLVFGTLLLFFIAGLLIEHLVAHFVQVNWYKEDLEREEEERLAELEAKRRAEEEAAMIAEAFARQSMAEDEDEAQEQEEMYDNASGYEDMEEG